MFTIEWKLLLRRLLLTCLIIFVAGIAMRSKPNETLPVTTTTTTIQEWNKESLDILIEKVAEEENFEDTYLLKRLVEIESQYLKYPKIVDTNGYFSYSILHFQLYTFIEQAEKFGVIPEDTDLDTGRILIMNPVLQLQTICRMDRKTIRQKWFNSWNSIYDL